MGRMTQQRATLFERALLMIDRVHPGRGFGPSSPEDLAEIILVWAMVLEPIPDDWVIPSMTEAIRRSGSHPPSAGDVFKAWETLDSRGIPDASQAVGWMYDAMHMLSEARYESRMTESDRRQKVRGMILEKLRESRLSEDYADSLTSFAMEWAPQIADSPPRGSDGSASFRAQVRDALRGAIVATTSWRRVKGLNAAEVTARMLGDGRGQIGGGA